MALFCSPIHCPKFPIAYAIQRPLKSKTSIIETPDFEISIFSISAQTKTLSKKDSSIFHSNLNHYVELEEEHPSNVVIIVKVLQNAGLAKSTGEGGLKEAFSRCGEVSRVKLALDKKTKQSLGFAYVWFLRGESALAAVEVMNGQFFEGRFIQVALVKPGSCKTGRDPSPYKF